MAAVTSPESTQQARVYFQTPPGSTEEAETPVRKQGRVTVKYDRKELRKRLNLEEWIIDQLTDLYDCEVRLFVEALLNKSKLVSTVIVCWDYSGLIYIACKQSYDKVTSRSRTYCSLYSCNGSRDRVIMQLP